MQNVVLGAYAYDISHSSTFVGVVIFAQLGPALLLAAVGGLIADKVNRKKFLILLSIEQLVFSLGLAWVRAIAVPLHALLVVMVVLIGVGNAMYGPTYAAIIPALVGRADLAGAISLNSAQMNASRVIGPVIGSVAYHLVGPAWVFAGNADHLPVRRRLPHDRDPSCGAARAATRKPLARAHGRRHHRTC